MIVWRFGWRNGGPKEFKYTANERKKKRNAIVAIWSKDARYKLGFLSTFVCRATAETHSQFANGCLAEIEWVFFSLFGSRNGSLNAFAAIAVKFKCLSEPAWICRTICTVHTLATSKKCGWFGGRNASISQWHREMTVWRLHRRITYWIVHATICQLGRYRYSLGASN